MGLRLVEPKMAPELHSLRSEKTPCGWEMPMKRIAHLLPTDATVILLAEDEVLVQNVARIALEAEGYFVLTAENGREALEVSDNFPGNIHLLLTDVRMPMMGGVELGRAIVGQRPDIRVLFMSGECPDTIEGAFMPKPFTVEILRAQVSAILDGWETRSTPMR
jgi:DNA-binding response OmpR family regulator